jgi:hypothetical protein
VKENQKMPQKIFTRCKDEGEKKKKKDVLSIMFRWGGRGRRRRKNEIKIYKS